MFIFPLLLFLLACYVRMRTVSELSYLAGAIELSSGCLCLLTSPFQIQLCVVGCLFFTHNRYLLASLTRSPGIGEYVSLQLIRTTPPSTTIDVQAQNPEIQGIITANTPSQLTQSPTHLEQKMTQGCHDSLQSPLSVIPTYTRYTYRGVTYLKSDDSCPQSNSPQYACMYRGAPIYVTAAG